MKTQITKPKTQSTLGHLPAVKIENDSDSAKRKREDDDYGVP